jgi:preprotein translocase subunit SecA
MVKRLSEEHYEKDEKTKNITLTEDGVEWAERQAGRSRTAGRIEPL